MVSSPFAFAGLWERWEKGEPIESCSLITTEANAVVVPVHDRMPVILDPDSFDRWLDPDEQRAEVLKALLQPLLDDWLIESAREPVSGTIYGGIMDGNHPEPVGDVSKERLPGPATGDVAGNQRTAAAAPAGGPAPCPAVKRRESARVVESGGTYSRNRLDRPGQKKDFHTPHEGDVAMRTRAYRPEAPACLEDRSLFSGVAGPSADPVIFSRHRLSFVVQHMQQGFDLFARYHDVSQIRSEVDDVVVMIPFGRADGVRASIDRIVTRMQREISAHVPLAFRSARIEVNAVIRADVEARVRAGDLVVR